MKLDKKIAIVTGAGRNIGEAIGHAFVAEGASVALVDVRLDAAQAVANAINATNPGRAIAISADVSSGPAVQEMVSSTVAAFGGVDILVNNAAVTDHTPCLELEEDEWDLVIDVTLKGVFLCVKYAGRQMRDQGRGGRIINIVSEVYHRSVSPFSAYVAAKGGQIGWTRSMASELASWGITVNMVAPGWIPTERHENDPQQDKDAYLALVPMGRWGVPRDIGDAVLYLASDEASFVSGQTLCVNGALTPW